MEKTRPGLDTTAAGLTLLVIFFESDCGDCVMVNGKTWITVTMSRVNFGLGQQQLDLSRVTLLSGAKNCTTTASPFDNATRHRLLGCTTVVTSYAYPSQNAPVEIPRYPYALTNQASFFGQVVYGKTADEVRAWQSWMTEGVYEDFREFLTGFIPIYGSGKACYDALEAYNTTNPTNVRSTTLTALACTGAALEAVGGGILATAVIANLMDVYRVSKATDSPLARVVEQEVAIRLPTAASAQGMTDALATQFKNIAALVKRCGQNCLKNPEAFAQAQAASGQTPSVAYKRVDDLARACGAGGLSAQGAIRFDPCNLGLLPSATATGYANTANNILQSVPELYQGKRLRRVTIAVGKIPNGQLVVALGGGVAPDTIQWLKNNTNWPVPDIRVVPGEPLLLPSGENNPLYHAERQLFREGVEQMGISRRGGLCDSCTEYFKLFPDVEIAIYRP